MQNSVGDMDTLLPALTHPTAGQALDIQQALWDRGLIRAAGAIDCLIAAYAVVNDAIILNSDRDFGYIAAATGGTVRQEFVPESDRRGLTCQGRGRPVAKIGKVCRAVLRLREPLTSGVRRDDIDAND
jgi:hypothetical protein